MPRLPTEADVLAGRASWGDYVIAPRYGNGEDGMPTLDEMQRRYLDALGESYSIAGACHRIGITRQTVAAWRNHHPAFNQAVLDTLADARADYWEALEGGLYRRALHEVRPEYKGVPVTAFFVAKRFDPAYRDNHSEPVAAPTRESLRFLAPSEQADSVAGEYTVVEDTPAGLLPAPDDTDD